MYVALQSAPLGRVVGDSQVSQPTPSSFDLSMTAVSAEKNMKAELNNSTILWIMTTLWIVDSLKRGFHLRGLLKWTATTTKIYAIDVYRGT